VQPAQAEGEHVWEDSTVCRALDSLTLRCRWLAKRGLPSFRRTFEVQQFKKESFQVSTRRT
jgi:hypothetical protein